MSKIQKWYENNSLVKISASVHAVIFVTRWVDSFSMFIILVRGYRWYIEYSHKLFECEWNFPWNSNSFH